MRKMDATLDEDFVNFESVSQSCLPTPLTVSGSDEELSSFLDSEASRREMIFQGDKKREKNNNDPRLDLVERRTSNGNVETGMMTCLRRGSEEVANNSSATSDDSLFATFSYNPASKRLTMIPVKYKLKEERRKVLKISINKLKKIDDPENWLCRSVLINNTVKKLHKETREEKINKHLGVVSATRPSGDTSKSPDDDDFKCESVNNDDVGKKGDDVIDNNGETGNAIAGENRIDASPETFLADDGSGSEFFYRKRGFGEPGKEDVFRGFSASDSQQKTDPNGEASAESQSQAERRCASRKKSLDEDGTADEILNLNEECRFGTGSRIERGPETEEVDECDVHDVLSQLYMPPTPRMLTAIDGDVEEDDDLDVVDIDSTYIDQFKPTDCQKPFPFEAEVDPTIGLRFGKREREEPFDGDSVKRRKSGDVFGCFNGCGLIYDNYLRGNRNGEDGRTNSEGGKTRNQSGDDEFIELEDEEDIERRLSQSLSTHYNLRKPEKSGDAFFDETCDNQYSCGHAVTMFGDLQSVTFHNLIAGLET